MSYSNSVKEKAIKLRQEGYSLYEISEELHIAKSTSSKWLSQVALNPKAKHRINNRRIAGQINASKTKLEKRNQMLVSYQAKSQSILSKINLNEDCTKLLCALLFWAEGEKSDSSVNFINSDPKMIQAFLVLLRSSFKIDDKKFRALIHLHDYHNEAEIKKFWSQLTNIPINQFYKSYHKPHTGKNTKPGYKGCISIRYYDHKVALELHSLYNNLVTKLTGVG